MEDRNRMDAIDQIILHKLSLYESLAPLELWYEIGEDHALKETVTKEEISSRLESLRAQGLVERVMEAEGSIRWALTVKGGEIER
jgi:DNA-binding HxlR family transcriptional regulator